MNIVLAADNHRTKNMFQNVIRAMRVPGVQLHLIEDPDDFQAPPAEEAVVFVDWDGKPDRPVAYIRAILSCMPDVPILLLTTKAHLIAAQARMKKIVSGFVYKPIDAPTLLQTLRETLAGDTQNGSISMTVREDAKRQMAILRVRGNLEPDNREDFKKAIHDLLQVPQPKLIVDLSGVNYLSSLFLGSLIDAGDRAKLDGKSLTAMLTQNTALIAKQIGLDAIIQVIVVGNTPTPAAS